MKRLFCLIVTLALMVALEPLSRAEDPDLAGIFTSKNLEGTVVISSLDGSKNYIYNEKRANLGLLPASTFKIANTLIALEEGAVANGQEIIKWDGKDRGVKAWNKDQNIDSAFPVSCVWFYQELANRVGLEKYRSYLKEMNYGNAKPGPEVTTFWLRGDLRISAVQQVEFIRKVYNREFKFKASSYDLLKKVMVIEQTPAYTLRAKTGWATSPPPVGWITGYLETKGQVWIYATNIEMPRLEQAPLREKVTMEAFKAKNIID